MQTRISSPFAFSRVSIEFIQEVLSGAGVNGVVIDSYGQDSEGIYFEANRVLTDEEKQRLTATLLQNIIRFQ